MHTRIRQSAAMMVVVLALFVMGQSANAALRDWFNFWPINPTVQEKTPSAGAQVAPGGQQPGGTPFGGSQTGNTQPNGTQQGNQGQQGQQGQFPGQGNTQGQFPGQGNTQGQFPGQQGQQNQLGQQGQQGQGGRFFCNSLKREASKEECDAADREHGGGPGQQAGREGQQGQQGQQQQMQPCGPNVFPTPQNPCRMEGGQQGNQQGQQGREGQQQQMQPCAAGQQPTPQAPCRMEGEGFKPPFPGTEGRGQGEQKGQGHEGQQQQMQPCGPNVFPTPQNPCRMEGGQQGQQGREGQQGFPGKGATEGQFPGQGATQGKFPGGQEGERREGNQQQQKQQPQQFNFDEQQERPQIFIDPQFIKQVTREMSDQTRELNRLLKAAKKIAGAESAVTKIEELLGSINDFKQKIKAVQGEDLQEAIDDFHQAQIWDELNGLRAKIELPKQLNDLDRQLKRTEKLIAQKSLQKLTEFGLNFDKIKADLAGMRNTITNVRTLLSAGNADDAQEAMQEIWQGGSHPGEIEGALQQFRQLTDGVRRIRNKEIQAQVKEIFQPVVDAINEGDYQEANQLLNELQFEMQKVFAQLYRLNAKGTLSSDLRKKLNAFEARIQQKLQKEEQPSNEEGGSTEGAP